MLKKILIGCVVLLVVIQFIPVDRTNPEVTADLAADMNVKAVLKKACYDCHSNETVWPWYSYVSPIKFMVAKHVEDGRRHLNFSDWETFDSARQAHAKKEIREEVEEGEMPLESYVLMHSDANLTEADIKILKEWTMQK